MLLTASARRIRRPRSGTADLEPRWRYMPLQALWHCQLTGGTNGERRLMGSSAHAPSGGNALPGAYGVSCRIRAGSVDARAPSQRASPPVGTMTVRIVLMWGIPCGMGSPVSSRHRRQARLFIWCAFSGGWCALSGGSRMAETRRVRFFSPDRGRCTPIGTARLDISPRGGVCPSSRSDQSDWLLSGRADAGRRTQAQRPLDR